MKGNMKTVTLRNALQRATLLFSSLVIMTTAVSQCAHAQGYVLHGTAGVIVEVNDRAETLTIRSPQGTTTTFRYDSATKVRGAKWCAASGAFHQSGAVDSCLAGDQAKGMAVLVNYVGDRSTGLRAASIEITSGRP